MSIDDVSLDSMREVIRAAAERQKTAARANTVWFLEMIPHLPWPMLQLHGYAGPKVAWIRSIPITAWQRFGE